MSTQPTDEEIDAVTLEVLGYAALDKNTNETARLIARAVLSKWGSPVVAGEPIAWFVTEHSDAVDLEWNRLKPTYPGAWRPLYTTPQPTQAQAVAVPLTPEQCNDLLAASFCIASVGDPTATIKPDDAERIITLLHNLGGITKEGGQP